MEVTKTVTTSFPGIRACLTSSSSESSSDSDSDCETWKRKKPIPRSSKKVHPGGTDLPAAETSQGGRILKVRRNNIWCNVIAEQSLTQSVSMTSVYGEDVYKCERDVESYSYKKPGLDSASHQQSRFRREYDDDKAERGNAPVKDRLGCKSIVVTRPLVLDFTEDDDEDIVINGIAKYLQEPKIDLIGRVVKFLGKPKAMELLHLTDEMENMGGILTKDGSRRRTTGGVFLYLLRIDKEVSNSMRRKIFEEERRMNQKLDVQAKRRKRNKRKRVKMEIEDDDSSLPPLSTRTEMECNRAEPSDEMEYDRAAPSDEPVRQRDELSDGEVVDSGSSTITNNHISEIIERGQASSPEPGEVLPRGKMMSDLDREDGEISDSD